MQMMAIDPQRYPPYRRKPFRVAYERLGYPQDSGSDPGGEYEYALNFLDRLLEEARRRGTDWPSTRLDAQSVVWWSPQGPGPPPPPLRSEHALNTILYGPPGTGKTWHTVTRAVAVVENREVGDVAQEDRATVKERFDEHRDAGRIEMVTFTQNTTYEDFVEGVRPVLADGAAAGAETSAQRSRKRQMSSSLPSSRETPSEPFGRPSFWPEGLARARPSRVRSEIRSRSTSANSAKSVVMTLVWMSCLPSFDADVLLERHEGDAGLGEGVEDGDDLTRRPTEPREFADDQAVAALENAHQLVEPAALLGSLSGGGRLDEVVDAEVVLPRVLEDGEALAAHVLLRGRDPQIGDGFHGLSIPWVGKADRVGDRCFVVDRFRIDACESLHHVQGRGGGAPDVTEPVLRAVGEVAALDHQRAPFPQAARLTVPLREPGPRAAVDRDDPALVVHLVQDHHVGRRLEDLVVRVVAEPDLRKPVTEAPLARVERDGATE